MNEGSPDKIQNPVTVLNNVDYKAVYDFNYYVNEYPDMKNYALPLAESTSQGGFGVLARGSHIHIGERKKIRAFTYWEKVDDIDLSVLGLTEDGRQKEFSWRTMAERQSEAITYSGDQTAGFNGGSEYFDIDTAVFRKQYPRVRYLVFCNNVYSGINFDQCLCRAGSSLAKHEPPTHRQ